MKILKRLVNNTIYCLPNTKWILILIIYACLLFSGFSCNDDNSFAPVQANNEEANPNFSDGDGQPKSESVLRIMYLTNFNDPDKNQLAQLLCNENYKKLVFQFFKNREEKLTLAAFAGKLNDKGYNPNFQILNVVDDIIVEDIQGKEVFLGELEMENNSAFKLLKESLNKGAKNDTTKNYILFTPTLRPYSARRYTVEFTIRFTNSLRGLDSQLLPGSFKLNPSPPYSRTQ
ncbi:hypothetical protein [Daejeonella oryzae]|uniref:hypothetical protein n=1 Tax=Daejeonella oryzae TaxID=1122943 RepID=UPI00041AEB3B|nr:hypothetical protein [Daejeonella oryzae]